MLGTNKHETQKRVRAILKTQPIEMVASEDATPTRRGEKTSRVVVTREEADVPSVRCWAAGALHVRPCDMSVELHAALRDLATCNAMRALRDHAMPFSPARPRDMQCHAHPMPCTPFLTFVKHSAHFLCMHALEYSAPGVCLCAEIVSRWSAHQRLSGMVRVSVFPSLDTVCRDHFPPPHHGLPA